MNLTPTHWNVDGSGQASGPAPIVGSVGVLYQRAFVYRQIFDNARGASAPGLIVIHLRMPSASGQPHFVFLNSGCSLRGMTALRGHGVDLYL